HTLSLTTLFRSTADLVRYCFGIPDQSSLSPCLFEMHARGYQSHVGVGLRNIPQRFAGFSVDLFRIQPKMITSLRQLVQESLRLPKLSQSSQTVDHPDAADCESALLSYLAVVYFVSVNQVVFRQFFPNPLDGCTHLRILCRKKPYKGHEKIRSVQVLASKNHCESLLLLRPSLGEDVAPDRLPDWLPSPPVLVIPELTSHLDCPIESYIAPHRRLHKRLRLPDLPYSTIRTLPFLHRPVR